MVKIVTYFKKKIIICIVVTLLIELKCLNYIYLFLNKVNKYKN